MNNLIQNIVFIEIMISAINLSFFLFAFSTADTAIESILYLFIVFYNFMTIFVVCFYADLLTNEVVLYIILNSIINFKKFVSQGLDVCNEIFFTNWYNWNQESKMLLKLMLLQSQKPFFMNMGMLAPMTLDTFKRICNTTYSYYTMMQRMRMK